MSKFPKLRSITDKILEQNANGDSKFLVMVSKTIIIPLKEIGFEFQGFNCAVNKVATMASYTFMFESAEIQDDLTMRKFMGALLEKQNRSSPRILYEFAQNKIWVIIVQSLRLEF